MLFKAFIVAIVGFSVVNADLPTITINMRKAIEWLVENSDRDHNSTIILGVGAGSMSRQSSGGDQTQVQAAYLDLIIALSKEELSATDIEAKLYFKSELYEFVGDFSQGLAFVNKEAVSPDSVYAIYIKSQAPQKYKDCLVAFYEKNPNILTPPAKCEISADCLALMLDSSEAAEIGPDLRNRYIMFAEKLHKCTNFNENYKAIVASQMEQLNAQVNKFLANIGDNAGELDPRLRYTFLRKVILLLINSYNVMTPTIVEYLESLYNEEGYCGVAEDEDIDKVVLTSQCFTIAAFTRQLLLAAQETGSGV